MSTQPSTVPESGRQVNGSASLCSPSSQKLLYGVIIFASAFLVFQVQPILGKIILPWFGGAAAVWSVCLLFFQAGLLLGYGYAHLLTERFPPQLQGRIHIALLLVSLLALPILPKSSWKPAGGEDPAGRLLLVLTVTVGLPYVLLSSTSPLLQAWYARMRRDSAPYRFYALSNTGSILALLSYPLIVEPNSSSSHQAIGWSIAYVVFALLCCVIASGRQDQMLRHPICVDQLQPKRGDKLLWVALAACGSALLLSVTNHISQNIAAIPLLWVIPLSLYLTSFIICFAERGWYRRGIFLRLLAVALAAMAYALAPDLANTPLSVVIPLFCAGLFLCCMVCHGELAQLKPHPAYLTSFYLMIALGGALGAFFVALVAPRIFSGFYELPISFAMLGVLIHLVLYRDPKSKLYKARGRLAVLGLVALTGWLCTSLYVISGPQSLHTRLMVRNFYGVLRVADRVAPGGGMLVFDNTRPPADVDPRYRNLLNGTIDHGVQFLSAGRRKEPTTYYGPNSGIGVVLRAAPATYGPLRVGVIGLGAGTIAAYGRPGDDYTFYEINPLVVEVANNEFSFLRQSAARTNIVLGDARLSLEREAPQQFDVLAVDAFSGDAIPAHLLTREAFALYLTRLKPRGIIAVHISNKYLDLQPVLQAVAASVDRQAVLVDSGADSARLIYRATWILVGDRAGLISQDLIETAGEVLNQPLSRLWTDDYSSVLGLLK